MQKAVNGQRSYDASLRRARAEQARERILAAARELFLTAGYGTTTITAVAHRAAVSTETVYKAFGGKPGLVRAIHQRSLLGRGPSPAEQRSDALQATETDPRVILERFGAFVTELSPLGSPVELLIRDAAANGDKDMTALLAEVDAERYKRMLHNAQTLVGRGLLAPGLSAEHAADVMWTYTAPGLYENLVVKRGWTPEAYGRFVGRALAAALLE